MNSQGYPKITSEGCLKKLLGWDTLNNASKGSKNKLTGIPYNKLPRVSKNKLPGVTYSKLS